MFDYRIENKLPGSFFTSVRIDLKGDLCPLGPRLVVQCNKDDRQFYRDEIVSFLNTFTGRTSLFDRNISQGVEEYIVEKLSDILSLKADEKYKYTGPESSTKELKLIEKAGKGLGS